MTGTALIILAAGRSSRLGAIKQLLPFHNKTLLQHVVDEAIRAGPDPVVVVTGANADEIMKSLRLQQAGIVYNENWKTGMASSIVAGLQHVLNIDPRLERIIVAVCDQPFVSTGLFKQLYETHLSAPANIVACTYAGTIGTPVLFVKKYFDQLLQLKGNEGAKKILLANMADVTTIDFPQGAIDVDTPRDYENLNLL